MGNAATNDDELSSLLKELWENTIIPLYKKGKIQTERHLQAYLFMLLKNRFEEKVPKDWDVWVEPQFYFWDKNAGKEGKEKMYKPDLVITRDDKIEGILELKFTPQERKREKNRDAVLSDFDKLVLYGQGSSNFPDPTKADEFLLELNPCSGAYDTSDRSTRYKRDLKRTKYFFLGIAWFDGFDLEEALLKKAKEGELKGEFISLLYSTHREGGKPSEL